jgi:hypothetical protein
MIAAPYLFAPGGGKGTFAVSLHFPVPELLPVIRPEASRCVPVCDPDGLPLVVELPVMRPEPSRYWVVVPEPEPLWVLVSPLPWIRPLASR